MSTQRQFYIRDALDVMKARRGGMEMSLQVGFSQADATKVAVVISELSRNILNYAGEGSMTIICGNEPDGRGYVRIMAEDNGPGISDVELAMTEGFSTSGGMGLGLSGSRRMMDEFEIESTVGLGTRVFAVKWTS